MVGEEGVRANVFGLWSSKSRTVRSKEASTASHHHSSARPAVPLICRFKHGVFMNYGAASKSTPSHVDGFAISLWRTPTIRAPTLYRSTKAFFRTANRKVVTAPGVIIAFVFGYLIVFSCACSVPSTRFRTFLGTF